MKTFITLAAIAGAKWVAGTVKNIAAPIAAALVIAKSADNSLKGVVGGLKDVALLAGKSVDGSVKEVIGGLKDIALLAGKSADGGVKEMIGGVKEVVEAVKKFPPIHHTFKLTCNGNVVAVVIIVSLLIITLTCWAGATQTNRADKKEDSPPPV